MERIVLKLQHDQPTPHPVELSQRIAAVHGVERSVFQPDEGQILIEYDPVKVPADRLHERIRDAGYAFPEDEAQQGKS
jgi:hypothetical protein